MAPEATVYVRKTRPSGPILGASHKSHERKYGIFCRKIPREKKREIFRKTPEEIESLIRGFDPWPGAFCDCSGTVMKLWAAQPLNQTCEQEPGTVLRTGEEGMDVSCGGRILRVTEIQMPGKKRVFVKDYLRGNSIAAGTLLK